MSLTESPPVDMKAGWSTFCRRGDCATCKSVGAKCMHNCHGIDGQRPPAGDDKKASRTPSDGEAARSRGKTKRSHDDAFAEHRRRREPVVELVWEEPPETRRRTTPLAVRLADALCELEANPGKWARLVSYAGATSAGQGRSTMSKALGKEWEFRAVKAPDNGGSTLYGRYVGKKG